MTDLEFINNKKFPIDKKILSRAADLIGRTDKRARGKVEVVFTDNREMRRLNRIWRGIDKTTDVLSFAWNEDNSFPAGDRLGQVFISYQQIKKQAKEYSCPEKVELTRMFVHGILHLVGYDHINKPDEIKMFMLQEKIVSKIMNYGGK